MEIRLILGCILFSITAVGCAEQSSFPKARQGVLDLTQWNFVDNGPVNLAGEWEIYWGQLLMPEVFNSPARGIKPSYATLPGLWKWHEIDGQTPPARGFTTYRLTVRMNPTDTPMALTVNRPLSVCKVWINGKPLLDTGRVGIDRNSETPRDHRAFQYFRLPRTEMTVVLQVSNFHNIQGGMIDPIRFGSEHQLQQSFHQKLIITTFLGGVLLIMGIFHLTLYTMHQLESANLYFGLYCILDSVVTLAGETGTCVLSELIPDLPWHLTIDMALMPRAACIPLLVMFYHALFPYRYSGIIERCYQAVGGIFLSYLCLTPPNAFDKVTLLFMLLGMTAFPYLLFRFILDLRGGKEGAKFMVPSYLFLIFATINDQLLEANLFESFQMIPFAMLFFILSYSYIISTRHSRTHTRLRVLSGKLENKNTQLVHQIRQTTKALKREKKEKSEKLRYQINPHFLFNSLTSIRGAILKERETARNMVSHLSEFCRMALSKEYRDIVTVDREIKFILHYLEMEGLRLGKYLEISVMVEPAAGKMRIPALIIHPIVENALKYGSRTSHNNLEVNIELTVPTAETLCIRISNTGEWADPGGDAETASTGIGLDNVRQRLRQYYGDAYGFEIEKAGGRVCIRIEIPGPPKQTGDGCL